jgi:hypothetical protein
MIRDININIDINTNIQTLNNSRVTVVLTDWMEGRIRDIIIVLILSIYVMIYLLCM